MTGRIVNIIQWASIVIGITGMSLDKLIPVSSALSYTLIGIAVIAFVVLVIVQLLYRDPNRFTGKQEVDLIWNRLLTGAEHSVWVFAGDVSWAEKNKDALSTRGQAGVELRVICRWPSTPLLLEQVRALFAAGVKVKLYGSDLVKVRGMVVDTEMGLENGLALTVVKQPKHRVQWLQGQTGTDSLFNYQARRYIPDDDLTYIATLHQFFDSIWGQLANGMILAKIGMDTGELADILSIIPHYAKLTAEGLSVRRVSISMLYSCCLTVKADRLKTVTSLLEGYRQFKIAPFEACRIERADGTTVILPPIVEDHGDGRLVVIDGMHRLYKLITCTDSQEALCLVITGAGPLPSDPIPFEQVRESSTKLPRHVNFPAFRPEYFRDIKAIDQRLVEVAKQRASDPRAPSKEAPAAPLLPAAENASTSQGVPSGPRPDTVSQPVATRVEAQTATATQTTVPDPGSDGAQARTAADHSQG